MAMNKISRFLFSLEASPEERFFEPGEVPDRFLGYWGYTIYRTYYGPGSDEQWSKLLKKITEGVEKGLVDLKIAEREPEAFARLWSRYLLDARSDPTILDGLTLQDLQKVYLEGIGGQPMRGAQPCNWRNVIYLYADAQVLQDPELRLLNVADAAHDFLAVHRNTRYPKLNFGWITIPPAAVLNFFNYVDIFTFDQIVTQAGGGPGAFWDPEEC